MKIPEVPSAKSVSNKRLLKIVQNDFRGAGGVALYLSANSDESHTMYYHNSFLSASQVNGAGGNFYLGAWDNGLEGNYWGDYTGIDSNHDGIGDTPVTLGTYNIDRFPLMVPYAGPLASPTPNPTVISTATPTNNFTISPSPTVPEFPGLLLIVFGFIGSLLAASIIKKRKYFTS